MPPYSVNHIICAVRGRPESRTTVTQAISLALEHQASLTFLHIIDAEFLEYATIAPLSVVYRELVEMARFAMIILCDRAQRRGVIEADYIVLEGNIRKQLHQFAINTHAEVMILGAPSPGSRKNVFKPNEFDQFIQEMKREGKIQIILARPEVSAGGQTNI